MGAPRDLAIDPSLRSAGPVGRAPSSREVRRYESRQAAAQQRLDTQKLLHAWRMQHGEECTDDPLVRQLIAKGIAPAAGGATGVGGMAFSNNLPAEGSYVMDSAVFFKETERNDVPQEQKAYTGLGGAPIDVRVPNNGIVTKLRVTFVGSLVVTPGTGAVTSLYRWPWNVLGRLTLNLNGQTGLISCEGQDLRARRQRIFRSPVDPVAVAPATDAEYKNPSPGVIAGGTYPILLTYDVPVVHNDYSLTGALLAQSDQTYISLRLTPGASAELFALTGTATVALTGTIHTQVTFYDIPQANTQEGSKVLIPDLQWLHGLISNDAPFANTGDVASPLIRTSGQLLCYTMQMDNGGAAVLAPTGLDEVRLEYGGNRRPRVHSPVSTLLEEMAANYNGLPLGVSPGLIIFDQEAQNPARDIIYPKGVTELKGVAKVPAGTTINANAKIHQVQETLYAGR